VRLDVLVHSNFLISLAHARGKRREMRCNGGEHNP
jgi:hypothetical protein